MDPLLPEEELPETTPAPVPAPTPAPVPDEEARQVCLDHWLAQGLSEAAVQNYEEVFVDVNLSGQSNSALVFEDLEQTSSERFLVVTLSGLNMNGASAILGNANGRYCLYFKSKNANGFTIRKHSGASFHALSMDYQNANGYKVEPLP